MEHTPGPWEIAPAQRWHVSDKPFTLTTYELRGGPEINEGKSAEVNANARLIAAAPDLLNAAQRMVNANNRTDQWAAIERANALGALERAIAKATEG